MGPLLASSTGAAPIAIAGTPDGKRFLLTSNVAHGSSPAVTLAWLVHVDGGDASISDPVEIPFAGQPAFDGSGFVVIGGTATGLALQRVALDGTLVGSPAQRIATTEWTAVTSVVAAPTGVAVAWTAWPGDPHTAPTVEAHAALLAADAATTHDTLLDSAPNHPDPNFGTVFAPTQLFVLQGRVVARHGAPNALTVTDLGWSGEPSASTRLPSDLTDAPFSMFVAGDRLMYASKGALFAGVPGGPFTEVATVDAVAGASDACGRTVLLANGTGQGLPWGPPIVEPLGGSPAQLPLPGPRGSSPGPTSVASIDNGFGVAWLDQQPPGSLQFAALTWQ